MTVLQLDDIGAVVEDLPAPSGRPSGSADA
ncbi:hypothetical protein ABH940_005820 [Streptacidiphilus sp. BW17]